MKRFRKMLSILISFLMIVTLLLVSAEGEAIQGENLALGATVLAESVSPAAINEGPDKLFDSDHAGNKWCVSHTESGWVAFKIKFPANINRVKVYHTGNSSLNNNWDSECGNTEDFSVQRLVPGLAVPAEGDPGYQEFFADDAHWVDIMDVAGNTEKITDTVATMEGIEQIYRLKVIKSGLEKGSTTDRCIRVLGLEMFGQLDLENIATVTFESNGGTGTMNPVVMEKNSVFTIPECTFTAPENHVFNGWSVVSPEGMEIVDNQITLTSDVVLQPVWRELNTYTVKFMPGEGTGTMDDITGREGSTVELPYKPAFTAPEGKVFNGWVVEGTSEVITEIKMTSNVTLTATWRNANDKLVIYAENDQSVIFNANGLTYKGIPYELGPDAVVEIIGNNTVVLFNIGFVAENEQVNFKRKLELNDFQAMQGVNGHSEIIYTEGPAMVDLDITAKGTCNLGGTPTFATNAGGASSAKGFMNVTLNVSPEENSILG